MVSSNSIAWVRNDEIMVTQDGGSFIDVALNLASIYPEHEPKLRVTSLVISNQEQEGNGLFLTVGTGNAEIRMWDIKKGSTLRREPCSATLRGHTKAVNTLAFSGAV